MAVANWTATSLVETEGGVKVKDMGEVLELTSVMAAVGRGGEVVAATALENSEVLPAASVAVAVTNCPAVTAGSVAITDALPAESVVTEVVPRKVWPSPKPEASAAGLEKNSMRSVVE